MITAHASAEQPSDWQPSTSRDSKCRPLTSSRPRSTSPLLLGSAGFASPLPLATTFTLLLEPPPPMVFPQFHTLDFSDADADADTTTVAMAAPPCVASYRAEIARQMG